MMASAPPDSPPAPGSAPPAPGSALLARLWGRTERPGCLRHTAGRSILGRHPLAAAVPQLAEMLLRRASAAGYTAPEPPVIVTASAAEPATTTPPAARHSPAIRATPISRNGVTAPHPAPPEPSASSGPTRPGVGTAERLVVSVAAPTRTPTRHADADALAERGPVTVPVISRWPADGARGSGGPRGAEGPRGAGGPPGADGAAGAGSTGNGADAQPLPRPAVSAISRAAPPERTWSTEPRPAPSIEPEHPSAPPSPGNTRSTSNPASLGSVHPAVVTRRVTGARRPVVRTNEAASPGIATRALVGGTFPVRTAPTVPPEANQRVDRPAGPSRGEKALREQHPAQRGHASRRDGQPGRPDDPARRDRDTPRPPRIDIDGIVTTVQRRLVHHMAVERERRGMPR